MDIERLLHDYDIQTAPEGDKHSRTGWINVACPHHHTDNFGYHLGFTLDGRVSYCWSCGIHWVDESIAKLLKVNRQTAKQLIIDYAGVPTRRLRKDTTVKVQTRAFMFPSNWTALTEQHKKYLIGRKFDPEQLEKEWELVSTGPVSMLDGVDYKHRILAPVYWDGRQVTFQARDVTNRHTLKYMACTKSRELIHHKHLIYRHPSVAETVGICVEGVTDVWRFGRSAFCTFGIEYTYEQMRLIARLYKRVGVCFDGDERTAKKQADKLIADLRFRNVDTFRIDIHGDPGAMKQIEADYIVKQIMK